MHTLWSFPWKQHDFGKNVHRSFFVFFFSMFQFTHRGESERQDVKAKNEEVFYQSKPQIMG